MVDVNKVNQINAQYDNKTVKIADNKGQVHEVKLSIFQDGMAVTSDTKDIASYFNFNKNGKLEADEVAVLKKVISDYAGADKKLEDKEILQIFGMTSESPNAAKMLQQFKNMVEHQAAGTLSNTVTNEDGSKRTESFNADGSGTVVEVSAGENPKRTTSYYGKGNVLLKKEQADASGTTTCEYTNNEEGQPVLAKSSFVDKDGNTVSTTEIKYTYENGKKVALEAKITDSKGEITTKEEKYTYNEQGLLVKTEGVKTKPAKLKLPNGQTGNSVEEYTEEREYHPNGELAKKVKTTGKLNLAGSVSTSYYNENGQLTRQEMQKNQLRIGKDKNGGMTLRQETTTQSVDFEYHSNGKKSKTIIKNV
ncbi:hypothetical protein IJ596_04415, partial [bacterium]|nr:hypothetical protein [bacterium]